MMKKQSSAIANEEYLLSEELRVKGEYRTFQTPSLREAPPIRRVTGSGFFLLLLLSLFTLPVNASVADSSAVIDLDELIVVSQPKEVLTLRHQPVASSVFAAGDLASLGASSLSDIAPHIPSFSMPAYGSRLTSSAYVRGIGSRVNNPAVGIYVDGIPLVNKSSYNYHTYFIDRIDVLRGPQGTLYGMNNEGGLIRIHSKNPMKYSGTDLHLALGTHLDRTLEVVHYHHPNDNLAFSVAAFYNGTDGFRRNTTTGRRADAANEAGAKTRLMLRPGGKLSIDLVAEYQFTDQDAFPYGGYDTETRRIAEPAANRENTYRRNMLISGVALKLPVDGLEFNSQTSYQFLRDRMIMDQDYMADDYMHLAQRQLMNALTQEITMKSTGDNHWKHSSGIYAEYQWLRTDAPVGFGEAFTSRISNGISTAMYNAIHAAMTARMMAGGMSQQAAEAAAAAAISNAGGVTANVGIDVPARFHTPQANLAVFHESDIMLTDRLTLSAGLRYDFCRTSLRYDTGALMPVTASVMGTEAAYTLTSFLNNRLSDNYSQLLPKLGLTLGIDDRGSNVYASLAKGYRAGGYNIQMFSDILQGELMANSSAAMNGDYDIPHTADDYAAVDKTISYKPEESLSYEVGAHLNLPGGAVQADISAYCMTIRNQQLSVMASGYGFGRMMVNAGRSRSLGVEMSLRGSAIDNRLSWAASYSFTNAEFTEYDNGDGTDYKGNKIPFVPSHTLAARADYRMTIDKNRQQSLTLGLNLTSQGETYWNEQNTARQPFYALLGAHATLHTAGASLRLWCNNITNTRYATFAFGSEATGTSQWFAQKGEPITAGIDITLHL